MVYSVSCSNPLSSPSGRSLPLPPYTPPLGLNLDSGFSGLVEEKEEKDKRRRRRRILGEEEEEGDDDDDDEGPQPAL